MENTLENKAKFFANYWGQKKFVFPEIEKMTPQKIGVSYMDSFGVNNRSLILKSLSSISVEDLKNIGFGFPGGTDKIEFVFSPDNYSFHWVAKKGLNSTEGYFALKDFDYLRSKGYALPWMGISVQKQIEYGWVKLSE
ncbi:MAG: hypothetical protein DCE86_05470 [Flavobacteriaceae bacterium]|nr:MAG: hypothetical protein DCE86_05470 [Flavobacteriaceae bacterium]